MPIFGTLDVEKLADRVPVTRILADEDWETDDARALTLSYEVDDTRRLELLPPALHPSIPLYAHLVVRTHGSSPAGAFNLAELRLMSRAGAHYGGYTTGAFASTPEAVEFLREHYGWAARLGEISLVQRYHGAEATVRAGGRTVLEMSIAHPQPITADDLLVTAGFHLARVGSDLRLIQSEPSYTIKTVQRGKPQVTTIDTEAFGDGRVKLVTPIVATYLQGGFALGRVRYLMDPTRPAVEGTQRL